MGKNGLVAEWLGSALQKLLQRFESAPDLQKKARLSPGFFCSLHETAIRFANLPKPGQHKQQCLTRQSSRQVHIRRDNRMTGQTRQLPSSMGSRTEVQTPRGKCSPRCRPRRKFHWRWCRFGNCHCTCPRHPTDPRKGPRHRRCHADPCHGASASADAEHVQLRCHCSHNHPPECHCASAGNTPLRGHCTRRRHPTPRHKGPRCRKYRRYPQSAGHPPDTRITTLPADCWCHNGAV